MINPAASSGRRSEVDHDEVRPLALGDRTELSRLVDADPIVNAVLGSRLQAVGTLAPHVLGGTVWGAYAAGRLRGAAFAGGNLLPVGGGAGEWTALASRLRAEPRGCTAIVGRAPAVDRFWTVLEPAWGPARAVRAAQPLLVLSSVAGEGDPRVRLLRPDDFAAYAPAAVAMFAEELGVTPDLSGDYRARLAGMLRDRRVYGILDEAGRIAFKADIGALSAHTCQLQGVWVRPDLRGRGLATAALTSVLRSVLALAPTVSLYVNDYNEPALRLYSRLGMREVATLSTVLF